MINYLILLPCAFLMNTSNNKSRVIEHGWRNVLRTTFGISPMPSNPDHNHRAQMNENKTSKRLRKRRNAVHQEKKGQVHSQIMSHNLVKSLSTGVTSALVVTAAEEASDCKEQNQKKPLEIMMSPEKLERAYQMRPPKIGLIGNEDKNVLECKASRAKKIRFSENGQILPSDLEEESEFLFGCK